jgi:type IV pilus assembly protein PilB
MSKEPNEKNEELPEKPPEKTIRGKPSEKTMRERPPGKTMRERLSGKTMRERLAHKSVKEILLAYDQTDMIEEAEKIAKKEKKPLHQVMVEKNFASGLSILEVISKAWSVEYVDLTEQNPDEKMVKLLSESASRKYDAVVFAKSEGEVSVAMADPLDISTMEKIHQALGMEIVPYLALPQDISAMLDKVYGKGEQTLIKELLSSIEGIEGEIEMRQKAKADITEVSASASEVEKFVNAVILGAMNWGASDIHIEPFEDPSGKRSKVIVRYRVDGMLKDADFSIPWPFRNAITSKIKIMTNTMDITERRVPQSGRIQLLARGSPIEFRVEVIPTIYGESCVMRILDRRSAQIEIDKLMFLPDTEKQFLGLISGVGGKKNFGLLIVCGPTGAGKSTTLYAALNYINRPDIKILTAEHPVEYNLDGVIQVPVYPEIKLGGGKRFDFAIAMRSFLRLDPDVIMVGEIRDGETARIATEASMTGHLVLSTVHTNDAPSTVTRLVEMGLPPYIVVATLKAVLAQRLARRLCDCKKPYEPTEEDLAVFKDHGVEVPMGSKLYKPVGCPECKDLGFKGRLGIHELLIMNDTLRRLSLNNVSTEDLKKAAMEGGMRTIFQDGLAKVLQGHTTIREVFGGIEEVI